MSAVTNLFAINQLRNEASSFNTVLDGITLQLFEQGPAFRLEDCKRIFGRK